MVLFIFYDTSFIANLYGWVYLNVYTDIIFAFYGYIDLIN